MYFPKSLVSRYLQCGVLFCLLTCCAAFNYANGLVIYTEDWPPVSFQSNGRPDGLAVEVAEAIEKHLGINIPVQVVPWARGYKAVQEEPDVLLFTVGRSEERERLMTLVGPVAVSRTVLYTRKGNAARVLAMGEGIYKLSVGAYRGSIFADTARKKGFLAIDQAATPQITAKMLMMGRFDLWSEGSVVVPSVLKEIGYSADDVEKVMVLDSLELYFAFSPRTSAATVKQWEDGLRWLKKEGIFQKIYQKWLPNDAPPPEVNRIGLVPQ